MAVSCRLVAALVSLLFAASTAHAAAGPFDASILTPVGPPPREGGTYAYRLSLRATADVSGAVEITLPSAAMFVRLDGLDGAELDDESRSIRWQGAMTGGQQREVTLTLVAGVDAAGHTSSLHVALRPWQGDPSYLAHAVEVESQPATTVARLGHIGITAPGLAVLGWLAATLLFWLAMRAARPRDAAWAPVVIMVPVGFLFYFALLAREDTRIMRLPETTCTVVDRVIDSRTASSSVRRSGPQTVYAPRLALRYADGDGDAVAQGFGTDSRLAGTRASRVEALLSRYALGAQVPCAIDARDPRRAYVERGFGGAYVFALIPLPVLALGLWGLWKRR